jgi:hypothetical protein
VHHAKKVTAWLSDKKDKIELIFLPPYAPESNPDEYLNRDFKTALRTHRPGQPRQGLLAGKGHRAHEQAGGHAGTCDALFQTSIRRLRSTGYLTGC